jgi:predicted RNA-binding Zn ribbon-like protein
VKVERPINRIRLEGGRPSLDFVNSIHDRFASTPEDYFTSPQRFAAWCRRAQLLDSKEAKRLKIDARGMHEVLTFREHLYELFRSRIRRSEPPAEAIRALDLWLHRAWDDLVLDPVVPQCLSWSRSALSARLPLERIALSALEVLRSTRGRLKQCESADSCGWLFYDDTKNNRRRWCAMAVCGVVEKMRRYRAH